MREFLLGLHGSALGRPAAARASRDRVPAAGCERREHGEAGGRNEPRTHRVRGDGRTLAVAGIPTGRVKWSRLPAAPFCLHSFPAFLLPLQPL